MNITDLINIASPHTEIVNLKKQLQAEKDERARLESILLIGCDDYHRCEYCERVYYVDEFDAERHTQINEYVCKDRKCQEKAARADRGEHEAAADAVNHLNFRNA